MRRSWATARRQARYRVIEAENDRFSVPATSIPKASEPAVDNPLPATALDKARAAGSALRSAVA